MYQVSDCSVSINSVKINKVKCWSLTKVPHWRTHKSLVKLWSIRGSMEFDLGAEHSRLEVGAEVTTNLYINGSEDGDEYYYIRAWVTVINYPLNLEGLYQIDFEGNEILTRIVGVDGVAASDLLFTND